MELRSVLCEEVKAIGSLPQPLPEGKGVNKAMGDGTLCLEARGERREGDARKRATV